MKKKLLLFSSLLWLTACPTPPENVPGSAGGGPQNGQQTPQGGPSPQGGPPPGGQQGGPQNGAQGGPQQGGPSPDGQPMNPQAPQQAAGAPGPNPDNGGQPVDPNNQNEGVKSAQGELEATSGKSSQDPNSPGYVPEEPPDGTPIPLKGNQEPNHPGAAKPEIEGSTDEQPKPDSVPDPNKPPEGGIVTDSLLIIVKRIPSEPAKPQNSQDELSNEKHVTFSGSATCGGCTDPLLLRVVRFIGPNAEPTDNDLITQKSLSEGPFSILIPKGDDSVALELLVDSDNTGSPSVGERFAVIEMGGQLIPSANKTDLSLDATDRKPFEQAPIPNGSPEK